MNEPIKQETIITEPLNKELFTALAKAQGEIENAKKDTANDFFKSKYADLASVINAAKKPLADNGLSILQLTQIDANGNLILITQLNHSSGQFIKGFYPIKPVKDILKTFAKDNSGNILKDKWGKELKEEVLDKEGLPIFLEITPQQIGSAITYARRYAYCAIVGIAQEDDDGNSASGKIEDNKPQPKPYVPEEIKVKPVYNNTYNKI